MLTRYVIKSTKANIGVGHYRVDPGSIPARQNPYGTASASYPNNEGVSLAKIDPRQRGGAAWALGYIACFAGGGLEAITMGAATGPAGMIYLRPDYLQPYFDPLAGPALYPLCDPIADLAAASGPRSTAGRSSDDGALAGVDYRAAARPVLWSANLAAKNAALRIRGFAGRAKLTLLNENSFARTTTDVDFLKKAGKTFTKVAELSLRRYAIARLSPSAE